MSKITVIGSFVVDMVAKMKRFPQAGETILGESVNYFLGGKGINQCVSVARLGGDAEMIGMLGDDENGKKFRKLMDENGIKSESVFSCEYPTAVAQVQIDGNGQNRICVIPSANYMFELSDVDKIDDKLKTTEIVLLQLELKKEVVEEIIRRAHKYGKTVILNPAPAQKLSDEILSMIDYITPNETELAIISGEKTDSRAEIEKALDRLLDKGVKAVVATLGKDGAVIARKDKKTYGSSYKVNAVDTVAAGDSFNGALAVAISEGKSDEEILRFANAMGALTVSKNGAIPSIHTRKEVEEFLLTRKQTT